MENNRSSPDRHETTDVHTRPIWISGALLAITCVLIGLAMVAMFNILKQRSRAADRKEAQTTVTTSVAGSKVRYPSPRLQVAPETDLAELRAREDDELNHYGWIDKNAGVVRIPIERAMDLIIQRGLPVRGQPDAPTPYRTTLDLQQARPLERETPIPVPNR